MSRVIRAQHMGKGVVPADVYTAQLEAAEIRARARAEAETIRQQAYEAGYAAGNAAAAQQLLELSRAQADLEKRTEHAATQAALLVAGQLLGSTLQAEPERILPLLRPHLSRMRRAQRIVLRLHPDDAAWLERDLAALAELREHHTEASSLELRSDADITRGGCVIESNIGELDARVETRLTLLAAALERPSGTSPNTDPSKTEVKP